MSSNNITAYSTPRLLAELSDAIIDYLRLDKKTLHAYGLVCKDWLPRARYNMFQAITLHTKNCAAFLQLLGRTPDIVACVKQVTLQTPSAREKARLAITKAWTDPGHRRFAALVGRGTPLRKPSTQIRPSQPCSVSVSLVCTPCISL